ncbi:MAG: glycosyltransferase family 39 protein, partial [Gemmataceae bacterium]|nr:glycosyltransferase family 39 protein [Gemmataceae bacterium]
GFRHHDGAGPGRRRQKHRAPREVIFMKHFWRRPWLVGSLLLLQAGLLAWMSARHAPTTDEPYYLVAGLSHLELGRYELCRVNPPLVRMVAALPVSLANPTTNWGLIDDRPGARPDREAAKTFLSANGGRVFWLFTLGRWACLPFSLLGGYVCYRWARDLYGQAPGLLALALWCFCPNVLAHAQLLTPDAAAAALGALAGYAWWRWLRAPGWVVVALAGLALGLAELTKTTLVVLFPLWPLLWAAWRLGPRPAPGSGRAREAAQLGLALGLGLLVLNAGYEFTGSLRPLGDYRFVSRALAGPEAKDGFEGNRFAGTWLAAVPVPFPQDYLLGIDTQRVDFERKLRSYLRGEWREDGGWWYYYLYALAIKVPLGTWLLVLLATLVTLRQPPPSGDWRDEIVLLAPAATILAVVSSQTGFTHHLKYVLPIFPFVFIWVGKVAQPCVLKDVRIALVAAACLVWLIASSLCVYPHSLSYFNELVGGPARGYEHLHDSNLDWGQDLLYLKRWLEGHPEARPLHLAYYGIVDPALAGIAYTLPPPWAASGDSAPGPEQQGPRPGWYAVSTNYLCGHHYLVHDGRGNRVWLAGHPYAYFLRFRPVGRAGYSIYIYHISREEANHARRELGLPALSGPADDAESGQKTELR